MADSEAEGGVDRDELADLGDEELEGLPVASPIAVGIETWLPDPRVLLEPVVARALGGILLGFAVLAWPDRGDRILARLVALAAVVLLGTAAWSSITARPRRWAEAALATVGIVVAIGVALVADQSQAALARLVGLGLVATAAWDVVGLLRGTRTDEAGAWVLSRSVAMGGVGVLILAFPTQVFAAITSLLALGWIVLSVLVLVATLDRRDDDKGDYASATRVVGQWLDDRPKTSEDRRTLYAKILYEGPTLRLRVARFFVLMGFASVIASMGVVTDSTAVVIGAMLIAPLMSPLMGIAISLVMGWPRRLARSALIAAGGIAFAITIGLVIGVSGVAAIDTAANGQILARSSPTVLDLVTALAAGAAGAYGLSRPDVSDSLPGVAIAISLVPPLTVVGIAMSQGDWSAGSGALLLFATNMLAIIVLGGLTFVVTGVTPIRQVAENQHRVRTAAAGVTALAALVIGALLLNGAQIAGDLLETTTVDDAVQTWIEEHPDYGLVRIDRDGTRIQVAIVGPSEGAPAASGLAQGLAEALDRDVDVDLRLIVEERSAATASPGG